MFYLRYDDIEGLFREAAENYQVNPDKAFDWDKINRSVHNEPGEEDNPEHKKNKFILWFFLLLAIGLLSYNIWSIESGKRLLDNLKGNKLISNRKIDNNKISLAQNESASLNKQQKLLNKNKNASALIKSMPGIRPRELTIENVQNNNYAFIDDNIQDKENHPEIKPVPIFKKDVELNNQSRSNAKNIPHLIDPLINISAIQPTKNSNIEKNEGSKFYAGGFVAPDVTFIKFQQSNGVGVTFGLTAGYQFNKTWSIESGISFDTKKYYTKGDYFDKSNVPDFNNAQLLSVSGSCNMFEVPINLRYKFPSNSDHNWTIAVGTSSYFLTKESYNYSATTGGQNVQGKLINYPSSSHLFAVINVGGGYEKKLSKLSLLIEPYYKIPIKGIGTGNLYMSSSGINIGVKKYFGKK